MTGSSHRQPGSRAWADRAVAAIEADQRRSADTHLWKLDVPALEGIDLYLKDESTHPTGSLKHRLARSLFLYALCNGHIRENAAVIEASSGSTAVSEAYFARMIGVPFYAVMPRTTSAEKIAAIEHYGGKCHFIDDGRRIYAESAELAARLGGHFMDQFTHAERATDWRGNNNIAESIFEQMREERHPIPAWVVMSAGTGGTTATIGRYLRYKRHATRLAAADVERSAFFEGFSTHSRDCRCEQPSRIEGIGRPRVEPSFVPGVIDHMLRIPDAVSLAAMRVLSRRLGRRVGGSTGTNFVAMCLHASRMIAAGEAGSLVTLICDSGERYANTYYSDEWLSANGLDPSPFEPAIEAFLTGGRLALEFEESWGERRLARLPVAVSLLRDARSSNRRNIMSSSITPINLGIVGVGKIVRDQHLPALAANRDYRLVAAASRNATVDGIESFPTIEAMLEATPDLDAVSLCMPPQFRYDAARTALAAGKHVFLEKPPGATVSEVEDLKALASARGVSLFASWHSRYAPAVEAARTFLASTRIRSAAINWKEDVRRWHPNQDWIWAPGGFGVFDPGINALSIATHIFPAMFITAAALDFPENRDAPVAARIAFRTSSGIAIPMDLDWLQTGPQSWDILAETEAGSMVLSGGGSRLSVDGRVVHEEREAEYPMLYRRFAEIVRAGISDVDIAPLQHVADAFMLGKRNVVAAFHD